MSRALQYIPLALSLAASSAAAEFPQFRGPTGDGHATASSLPIEWNATTNVAWKTPIPGRGWSSPSLHQGRLYLTTAAPNDPDKETGDLSLRAYCLDAVSGEQRWM